MASRSAVRGRGVVSNAGSRFNQTQCEPVDDGWSALPSHESVIDWYHNGNQVMSLADDHAPADTAVSVNTRLQMEQASTIITRNQSPDVHFDRSINPYRGCEHGCAYCFARPTHTYLGHSAGLDFETRLYAKANAPQRLLEELAKPSYQVEPIAIGVNTDAHQPLERKLEITRELLTICLNTRHPVYLITKSALIERDIDIISKLAQLNLVTVALSITTLDNRLSQRLEPRAAAPHRRLRTIQKLSDAGIPVSVSVSPIIPALNEHELENIVKASVSAGAIAASSILLRLPNELGDLFPEWLDSHYPMRKHKVLKAIRSMRGGNINDATFGRRTVGVGPRAALLQQRLKRVCQRSGISAGRHHLKLDCHQFKAPSVSPSSKQRRIDSRQLALF